MCGKLRSRDEFKHTFHLLPGFNWLEARGMYARRSLSGKEGKKQERVWIPRYQDWILKAIAWKITTDIGDRLLRTNNRVQSRAGGRGWWGFLWGKFSWKLPPEWLLCFSWVTKTKLNTTKPTFKPNYLTKSYFSQCFHKPLSELVDCGMSPQSFR